jgi:hypothetical protein
MKNAATCPISGDSIDHNVSRVTCVFTIIALAPVPFMAAAPEGHGVTAWTLAGGLMLDYAIRAWAHSFSPMQLLACRVARTVGLPERLTDRAPQAFAYQIGFFLAMAIVVLLAWAPAAATVISANLLFFNALDGVFDFCVGCWIYSTFLAPRRAA